MQDKENKSSPVSDRNLFTNTNFLMEQPNQNQSEYESEENFEIEWLDDSYLESENISSEETMEWLNDVSINGELSTHVELKMYKHQGTQTE